MAMRLGCDITSSTQEGREMDPSSGVAAWQPWLQNNLGEIRRLDSFARFIITTEPRLTQCIWLQPHKVTHRRRRIAENKINGIRTKFVKELKIGPPKHFRMIDCRCTIDEKQVVLIDWHSSSVAYSAISHTFGKDVYGVFDCECASKCNAQAPRCSPKGCPGHDVGGTHAKIISDILNMCVRLRAAGAEYVWHDGVCIAQHDEAEVRDTIQHMGWIYGNAKETFIFLHYVGNPVAPIRHDGVLISRWDKRAWTLQEAALSKRRRYCLRRCGDFHRCQNLKQFEAEIGRWYEDDSTIAVVEEDAYLELLTELIVVLARLIGEEIRQIEGLLAKCCPRIRSTISDPHTAGTTLPVEMSRMRDAMNPSQLGLLNKSYMWIQQLRNLRITCTGTCCFFPTIETVLSHSSLRSSKHEGDRINSILALAGVSDFVAPKDGNMASSTIEFFKRQGQDGLGRAVFSVNYVQGPAGDQEDSWVPCLSRALQLIGTDGVRSILGRTDVPNKRMKVVGSADYIRYEVLQNGRIQLSGNLAGLSVEFTFRAGSRKNRRARSTENSEGLIEFIFMDRSRKKRRARMTKNSEFMRMDLYYTEHQQGFTAYRQETEMGTAIMCKHRCQPHIKGELIEDGESFRAHLVYPVAALRVKANNYTRRSDNEFQTICSSVPALIIQGDLEAEEAVSKIGHFTVYPAFQNFLLAKNRTYAMITRLDQLVLK